jgi:hypothetical protein
MSTQFSDPIIGSHMITDHRYRSEENENIL